MSEKNEYLILSSLESRTTLMIFDVASNEKIPPKEFNRILDQLKEAEYIDINQNVFITITAYGLDRLKELKKIYAPGFLRKNLDSIWLTAKNIEPAINILFILVSIAAVVIGLLKNSEISQLEKDNKDIKDELMQIQQQIYVITNTNNLFSSKPSMIRLDSINLLDSSEIQKPDSLLSQ